MVRVSQATLKHIFEKHQDLIRVLGIDSLEKLREVIVRIVEKPDEIYVDAGRNDVKYYLKKLDDEWITVILVGDEVKTAYLIGLESYRKFRRKRWSQHY